MSSICSTRGQLINERKNLVVIHQNLKPAGKYLRRREDKIETNHKRNRIQSVLVSVLTSVVNPMMYILCPFLYKW